MFYEYALEPSVISNWDRARYFLDALGPSKGRFLAQYPAKWKKMIIDGLKCADIEKHKIIEKLSRLDSRVISPRRGAQYEPSKSWQDNAYCEHAREAFHAVVVAFRTEGVADGMFVAADDVTDEHPLWHVEPGKDVARDPAEFVRELKLLLYASKHIAVIDPHFRADQWDKLEVLAHLCKFFVTRRVIIHFHTSDADIGYLEFRRHSERAVPKILPEDAMVTLYCWKSNKDSAERFHNRYIITDVGGVQFGDGIERGATGQSDRLSILGATEREQKWGFFYGDTTALEHAGPPLVLTAKR